MNIETNLYAIVLDGKLVKISDDYWNMYELYLEYLTCNSEYKFVTFNAKLEMI